MQNVRLEIDLFFLDLDVPPQEFVNANTAASASQSSTTDTGNVSAVTTTGLSGTASSASSVISSRQASMARVPEVPSSSSGVSSCSSVTGASSSRHSGHSRNSSWDQRGTSRNGQVRPNFQICTNVQSLTSNQFTGMDCNCSFSYRFIGSSPLAKFFSRSQ